MPTALVAVDMLNDFVDGVLGNPAAKGILRPITTPAAQARARRSGRRSRGRPARRWMWS